MTIAPELRDRIVPLAAGWDAGEHPWDTCYGIPLRLASDARRFDVSPAWLSWHAAAATLELFEAVWLGRIHEHNLALANRLRTGVGLEPGDSAIVSLDAADDAPRAAGRRRGEGRGRCWLYRGLTGHCTNSEIPPRSLLGRTAAYQRPSRHRPRRCGRVGTRDRPAAAEKSRRRGRRRRSSAAHPAAAEARRTLDVSVENDDLGKRGGGLRGDARSLVEILRRGHLIGDDARSRSPGQGGPDSSELRASARRMLAPCRMDTGVALAEQSARTWFRGCRTGSNTRRTDKGCRNAGGVVGAGRPAAMVMGGPTAVMPGGVGRRSGRLGRGRGRRFCRRFG